ncbi:hypothetical protein [Photobacterium phosphoreum]|uniref:hypothetical protein n=1 Tax=Photobacterium phosphoreum TaxID=659 RepID=UPI0039B00B77
MKDLVNYNDGNTRIKINYHDNRTDGHELMIAMGHYMRAVDLYQKLVVKSVIPHSCLSFEYLKAENASIGIVQKTIRCIKGVFIDASSQDYEKMIDVEKDATNQLDAITNIRELSSREQLETICEDLSLYLQDKHQLSEPPFIEPLDMFHILNDISIAYGNLKDGESVQVIHDSDNVIMFNPHFRCTVKKSDIRKIRIEPFDGQDKVVAIAPINEGKRQWIVKSIITQDEYFIKEFVGDAAIWKDAYMRGDYQGVTSRDLMYLQVRYNKVFPPKSKAVIREAIVSDIKVNYDNDKGKEQGAFF